MKFQLTNYEHVLDVRFHRKRKRSHKKNIVHTACIVSIPGSTSVVEAKYLVEKNQGTGLAKQNHLDNNRKEVGRKIALGKALKAFNRNVVFSDRLDKETRTELWKEYCKQCKLFKGQIPKVVPTCEKDGLDMNLREED